MEDSQSPTWRFAPTGGGAEYGKSPGQHYFVNDAVTKTVREVLQNSLDHPTPGLATADVTFKLTHLLPQDAGVKDLRPHVESSLQEVIRDQDTDAIEHYRRMLEAISKPSIPCLAITDSGTIWAPRPQLEKLDLP